MELILWQSNQLFSNNPGSALRLAGIVVAATFQLETWHNELGLDQETSDRLAAWQALMLLMCWNRVLTAMCSWKIIEQLL